MWMRILFLVACVQLAGCAAVSGFPEAAFNPKEEDAALAPYLKASAIANYETCVDKMACRNTIIDARLRAVDLAFFRFQRKIYGQEARISLGSDVLAMTLDSVAAITATRGFAAGASAVTGSRDAYEKQVLSVSMPLLFEEMIAKRREILLRIRQGELMPVAAYSLFQALDDISEYELAGSIPAAATELAANAGAEARAAQKGLDALRAASFANATAAAATAMPAVATTPTMPFPSPSPATPSTGPTTAAPVSGRSTMPSTSPPAMPSTAPAQMPSTSPSTMPSTQPSTF